MLSVVLSIVQSMMQWCFLMCYPQLADTYGNVYSIRLGNEKWVVLSGYKMVKEAIMTQAENFVDRPYSAMSDRIYSGTSGVNILSCSLSYTMQK